MRRKKIWKTKLLFVFVSFIFCAAIGSLLLPGLIRGSCRINDISLEKVDNFTKLTIYADKPFEFVHSTLEKKDGKPYRVIIDCKEGIHNLPQHNFKKDLPRGAIKAIRTSQFKTEPEKIVRIVLDVDKPVIYKVIEKGGDKRGTIAMLTAQDPSFPFWAATKNEKEASKTKLASSSLIEKTSEEKSRVKDNMLISSENRSGFGIEQPENAKGQDVKRRTAFEKPLCFADTSETGVSLKTQNSKRQVSQISTAEPETEQKDVETKQKTSIKTGKEMVLAATVTSPEVFSAPYQKNKKIESDVEKEAVSPAGETGKRAKGVTQKSESSSMNLIAKGTKEYVEKEPPLSPKESPSPADEAEKAAETPSEATKPNSMNLAGTEEKVALLNPEEKSTKEKAGPPESLVVASKPEGTALEAVPKRGIIYYHGEGKRDPFVPLTGRIDMEFGEISPPTFESLKLVGILKDESGNRALLEDERGYGYIMKNGDKIKNGYVVSVEDNKVVFQIHEYGWSKTIALELSN